MEAERRKVGEARELCVERELESFLLRVRADEACGEGEGSGRGYWSRGETCRH